ncbi:hypothetical protein N7465_006359 [Penicillium sp. CMV-2018d]|nr:hypothetical protein N7465_006359 [Penicillium sp. CMV-2018d]
MFAWMLIPLFERIDVSLEKYGDFNSLQKFRLAVVNYYIKHDPRLKDFNLGELLQGIFAFDLMLRYSSVRWAIGVTSKDFTNWNPCFQPVHFVGLMIPIGLILNGISILISGMTAQEEVDAAAVSVVAVKNVNQLPEDAGELVTAL